MLGSISEIYTNTSLGNYVRNLYMHMCWYILGTMSEIYTYTYAGNSWELSEIYTYIYAENYQKFIHTHMYTGNSWELSEMYTYSAILWELYQITLSSETKTYCSKQKSQKIKKILETELQV